MTMWRALLRSLLLMTLITAAAAAPARAQSADLVVTKSGPAQAAADTDVTYTVMVFNAGPDDSASISLNDTLPSGMTFVSAAPPGCTTPAVGSGGTVSCTIPSLTALTSVTFTFVFHIPPATPPGTVFTNLATASSPTDETTENNTGVAVTETPPPPQADVGVTKTGPTAVAPNSDFAFTISVHNSGPDPAAAVTWQDTLPGNLTFVSLVPSSGGGLSCTTPSVGSGGSVSCTLTTLAVNATASFTLTVHVPAGTPSGTSYHNVVTLSATTADPNAENNSASADVIVSTVDVSVAKQGPLTVAAGDPVSYGLTVANAGPDAALNVNLVDTLPPDTTFVSFTQDTGPPPTSCSLPAVGGTGTVSCLYTVLTSGTQATFTLVIKAGNTPSITNTVTASSDSFDTNTNNNSASATTTVSPRADVQIVKTGPATVTAGTTMTYVLTAANNGPSDAAGVSVTDTLPSATTFVSLTQTTGPTFTCTTPAPGATGTVTCTIATLPPGGSAEIEVVVKVLSSTPSGASVINTASISTTTIDPKSDNNTSMTSATVTTRTDLGVTKTGPTVATAGTDVEYTIIVTDTAGPSDAAGVTLTDTLPPGTTFVSENQTMGPSFACVKPAPGATGTVTCTLAVLPVGASATFKIVVHVSATTTGAFTNTATVTATTPDSVPDNNSASATTTTPGPADLEVTKTASTALGRAVSYTIVVTNHGPAGATNVVVTDVLPAGAVLGSATPTQGSCSGTATVVCNLGSLALNGSATITLSVTFPGGGTFSNTATVASGSVDLNPANNSSTVSVTVSTAIPALSPPAFALLAAALAAAGFFVLRRRPAVRAR